MIHHPSEEDMAGAYHLIDCTTQADGRITGWEETNDDNDDGEPDPTIERWQVTYRDRAEFDRRAGKSRIGISGVKVTVMLDGKEIT